MVRPNIPLGSHPLETGRYVIGTAAIESAYRDIYAWARLRLRGAMVTGPSCYGKTYAIKHWHRLLAEDFPQFVCYTLLCQPTPPRTASEGRFWEWLLGSFEHELALAGSTRQKHARVLEFLRERLTEAHAERLVLIIDDAQGLHPDQYGWLMGLSNELESNGHGMTVFLVGQPELNYQRTAFIKEKRLQLIGRFMVRSSAFHGIRSANDLSQCLQFYDNAQMMQFPRDSGYSFTHYYFTRAFETGWRAQSLGEPLWQAFQAALSTHRRGVQAEIPMQDFITAVRYLFMEHEGTDAPVSIDAKAIREAVRMQSGIREREAVFDKLNVPETQEFALW